MTLLVLSPVAGFLVGSLYLAWLWHDVRGLVSSDSPRRRFASGIAARFLVLSALLGGLLVAGAGAGPLVLGMVGFLAARIAATRGLLPFARMQKLR